MALLRNMPVLVFDLEVFDVDNTFLLDSQQLADF